MKHLIRAKPRSSGLTQVLSREQEPFCMDLHELNLEPGEHCDLLSNNEQVAILLKGRACIRLGDEEYVAARESGFDENVCAVHVSMGTSLKIFATSPCEWMVLQTPNANRFAPRIFDKNTLVDHEQRGKGMLGDTSHRIVRTFFDSRNREGSQLVVGEVVNFGGKWSSYPPHHHPQPEIYYYRFDDPRGYGHGEVGDDVYKIRDRDTLLIPPLLDHAQVSAPGYAMYYLWAIRETEPTPYTKPIFTTQHAWLLE